MPYIDKNKEREHKRMYYQKNKVEIDKKNREWREKNLDRSKLNVRLYYEKNKEKAKEAANRWKKRNIEKVKEYNRIYRSKNRCSRNTKNKEWKKNNPDKVLAYIEKNRDKELHRLRMYKKLHPEKAREYSKKRRENDIQYKLRSDLRHRIYIAIKNSTKVGSAVRDLGCSISDLKIYLEKKFKEGMNWTNWSPSGWHIDHIIPLSHFDLTDREQFLKAVNYKNLQPLWAIENIRKSNKLY